MNPFPSTLSNPSRITPAPIPSLATRLLSLLAFGILASSASATTYYVDFAAGSDTRTGTTKETAWKRCPGDEAAEGVAAATQLKPGDVVQFKGSVVYAGGFTLSNSGAPGSFITYDGNSADTWGKGKAIIDRGYVAKSCINFKPKVSDIVINGFELRNSGGYRDDDPVLSTTSPLITAPPGGSGIVLTEGENNRIQIKNILLHRIGQWRNQLPFSGTNSITGQGISVQNCQDVVVENCEFTKMRNPVSIKATTITKNVSIVNCSIHDYLVWGIDVAPRLAGATLDTINIVDCKIFDYHQYDKGNWLGAGEKPHTDGIFLRTAAMQSVWKNVNVVGCSFFTDNPGKSQGGTASIYVSEGPSVNIYNNVFINDPHSRVIGVGHNNPAGQGEQIVRIYNNTFIDGPSHIILAGEADTAKRSVYIQNNIFRRNGAANSVMFNHQSGVLPKALNNNLYWSDVSDVNTKYVATISGGYQRFSSLRSLGYEANGKFGNPNFRLAVAPRALGLDLGIGSGAAVGMAANLYTYLTQDKAKRSRPRTGQWDAGAYLSGSQAASLSPPVGYRPGVPVATN